MLPQLLVCGGTAHLCIRAFMPFMMSVEDIEIKCTILYIAGHSNIVGSLGSLTLFYYTACTMLWSAAPHCNWRSAVMGYTNGILLCAACSMTM